MKKKENGQIIVFVLLSIFSLVMFWLMIINIGKLITERIMMQNAADAAAQTASCIKARALNKIGSINAIMAGILSVSIIPFNQKYVWYPEWKCRPVFGFCYYEVDNLARTMKKIVDNLANIQEGYNRAYGGGFAFFLAREVAKRQKLSKDGKPIGADNIVALPEPTNPFSLRLLRNQRGAVFYGTINIGYPTLRPPYHAHYVLPCPWKKHISPKTWYVRKPDFHKKKITIVASKTLKGWPWGKKLFGIKKSPTIQTIASSIAYNTKGPMFTDKYNDWTFYPILEYWKAKDGGWDAQLVPVKKGFQH